MLPPLLLTVNQKEKRKVIYIIGFDGRWDKSCKLLEDRAARLWCELLLINRWEHQGFQSQCRQMFDRHSTAALELAC